MNYIGISCGYHDAAASVINDSGKILFASHSERYSGIKHDRSLSMGLIDDVFNHADDRYQLHYYERPWVKYFRQLRSGERPSIQSTQWSNIIGDKILDRFNSSKIHTWGHHLCHAAAGFQTSPYDRATVVVIDAIGEWDTATIWGAYYENGIAKYKRLWSRRYPHSIGLFYSAVTSRVGLRPLDEEYILMGMAAWGKPTAVSHIELDAVESYYSTLFKENFHAGVESDRWGEFSDVDIAASTQTITEELIAAIMDRAHRLNWSSNLVYGGGVALNCTANRLLGRWWNNIWIMPNPGDAGSSLGAAALGYGRKLQWTNAYLGHEISGDYPVNDTLRVLLEHQIVGVASGRSEWGPRALGNRSLLADPRGSKIKDTVNGIKRRQKFRPFAPVILEEFVHAYFDMPRGWDTSRYMQVVAKCTRPDLYPAIVHVDGSSRVQTVPNDGSGIRTLLEEWYKATGCPLLLNTSLNIRGEPMVNDRHTADRFESLYGVTVCS